MSTAAVSPALKGNCAGCGRGIRHEELVGVTKWASVVWGRDSSSFRVLVPVEMHCAACFRQVEAPKRTRIVRQRGAFTPPVQEAPPLDVRQKAALLLGAMSADAHGSKWLAAQAGLEYDDSILLILRKLRDAGKCVFEDGRWRLA